jgi:hypothetical protein
MNFQALRNTLGLIAVLGALTTACERLEPAPETDVKFQATGTYTLGGSGVLRDRTGAVLIVRQRISGYFIEINDKDSGARLVNGFMPPGSLETGDARGPMKSALLDTDRDGVNDKLSVSQDFKIEKPVTAVAGPKAGSGVRAVFGREESRWMWFSAGYLEHGTKGRTTVSLKDAAGAEVGLFDGLTTTEPVRKPVASDIPGNTTHGREGWTETYPSRVVLILPNGAGTFQMQDYEGDWWRETFTFNPRGDVTGRDITMDLLTASPEYVEMSSELNRATIKLNHVVTGGGDVVGNGEGHLSYKVTVAVTQRNILVTGMSFFDGKVDESDGQTSQFEGKQPAISVMLDW